MEFIHLLLFEEQRTLYFFFFINFQKEIIKSFEKSFKILITQGIFEKIDKGMHSVIKGTYPLSLFLVESLKNCFKKGVFLKPLESHFLRLAIQIISRFCSLCESYTKILILEDNSNNQEKICFISNEIDKTFILIKEEKVFEEILVILFMNI